MKRSKLSFLIVALLLGALTLYAAGCGSGVEWGAKKFTLTGAGS